MKNALVLCLAMLLWACGSPRSYGPESPYYRFPEGGQLVLHQGLEVPAHWATARIQFGRLVAFGQVQEQEPHCIFEINTVRPEPQRIEPDRFAIIGVERSVSELALASGGFVKTALMGFDRPSQMFYKTTFTLRSVRQPGVLRMTCQSDQYAAGIAIPRHLTVAEIRQALGDLFTLQLP